jgi:trehalose-phosphatase
VIGVPEKDKGKDMKVLNSKIDMRDFIEWMRQAGRRALFLDYDGTLAPFHVDPKKAKPYAGVTDILDRIMHDPKLRLVIISGRWTKDLLPLLNLDRQPEIWGSHGLERLRADGTYEITKMDEMALNGLVAADDWVDAVGLSRRCEKKPGCLAVHWRGLNEKAINTIRNEVGHKWSLIAKGWNLKLRDFDGGLELCVPGRNKGDAVKVVLGEMKEEAAAAYLGDDLTDEDAFKTLKGSGMGVLVREELRQTNADVWIKPPKELLAFLSLWLPQSEQQFKGRVY